MHTFFPLPCPLVSCRSNLHWSDTLLRSTLTHSLTHSVSLLWHPCSLRSSQVLNIKLTDNSLCLLHARLICLPREVLFSPSLLFVRHHRNPTSISCTASLPILAPSTPSPTSAGCELTRTDFLTPDSVFPRSNLSRTIPTPRTQFLYAPSAPKAQGCHRLALSVCLST